MRLTKKEKVSYGLGAVGKDMVYMLSANYILYYYQDIMGVSAFAMGVILMAARIFDAFNDPIMGVVVAKTKTRWGKFRPWLLIGTVMNAIILYLMFMAPPALNGGGLVAYAAVFYVLWGVTYTMMDIPFWSMIPAFTEGGKERENLSTLARSCAGVGSALITIITMLCVPALGSIFSDSTSQREIERVGFGWFALIIAAVFILFTVITCLNIKEKSTVNVEAPSVGQMFKALVSNDQAMTVVITIVLINCSLYITSNLLIYFFKYDIGGAGWNANYVLFNTFGGGIQIISMMLFYPLFRKFISAMQVFYVSFVMAIGGYAAALLYLHLHIPYVVAVIAGGLIAAICSIIIGYPTLKMKLRGDYFAIATLGFGEIVKLILANSGPDSIFGGAMGVIGIPKKTNLIWVIIFTVISIYVLRSIIKSDYGKNFVAIQQQAVAAEMIGINVFKVKMTSLLISAFYAGIAGGLFAFYMTYISPGTFNEVKSTDLTTAVVMGGINSISGPILCGFFLILLPEVLRSLIEWRLVIYGLIFVLVMIFKPEGLFGYKELPFEKVTAFAKKLIKPRGKEDTMEKCAKDRRPTIRGGKK